MPSRRAQRSSTDAPSIPLPGVSLPIALSPAPAHAAAALTEADVRRALTAAHRRLARREDGVTLVFERIQLRPPRPARPGTDVPPWGGLLTVIPVRARYSVHRRGETGRDAGRATTFDATYRFWRTRRGGWGFTGPLTV